MSFSLIDLELFHCTYNMYGLVKLPMARFQAEGTHTQARDKVGSYRFKAWINLSDL